MHRVRDMTSGNSYRNWRHNHNSRLCKATESARQSLCRSLKTAPSPTLSGSRRLCLVTQFVPFLFLGYPGGSRRRRSQKNRRDNLQIQAGMASLLEISSDITPWILPKMQCYWKVCIGREIGNFGRKRKCSGKHKRPGWRSWHERARQGKIARRLSRNWGVYSEREHSLRGCQKHQLTSFFACVV